MFRFFFNVEEGSIAREEVGMKLPGLKEAKSEAVRYAGRLLCDEADEFWSSEDFSMSVSDEDGLVLFTLRLVATEAPVLRALN